MCRQLPPQLVEMERRMWESRSQELNTNVNIARDQLRQRQQELRETQANRDQASSSCSLTSEELSVTRPLLKSGAVSEVDLLRLQRDVARFCGEARAAGAQVLTAWSWSVSMAMAPAAKPNRTEPKRFGC